MITWINSHGNPQLDSLGVRIELGWFQPTASGYYQLGILVVVNECFFNSAHQPENLETNVTDRTRYTATWWWLGRGDLYSINNFIYMSKSCYLPFFLLLNSLWLSVKFIRDLSYANLFLIGMMSHWIFLPRKNSGNSHKGLAQSEPNQPSVSNINSRKRMTGGVNGTIINDENLQSLHYKRDFLFPFSLLLQNTRPIGFKVDSHLKLFFWVHKKLLRNTVIFLPSGCIAASNLHYALGWFNHHTSHIASILLDVTWGFSCTLAYSPFIIDLSLSSWYKCSFQSWP